MMAAGTLVSVVVPVFNGERSLRSALESVTGQTHRNLELIVVDDGSTDATGAIIDELAEADERIRPLHQPNRGVSAARNRGLAAAAGEWVVFVDADDMLIDPLLCDAIVLAGGEDADIVCFGSSDDPADIGAPGSADDRSIAGGGDFVGGDSAGNALAVSVAQCRLRELLAEVRDVSLDHRSLATMIADESANAVWDKAYRRTLLDEGECRFVEGLKMGEDLVFNLACLDRARTMTSVPIIGHFYRRDSAGSATDRYLPDKFRDLTLVGDRLGEWARSTGSAELVAAVDFIRAKNVFSCMRDLHHRDCEVPRKDRLARAKDYRAQVPSVRVRGLGPSRRLLGSAYNLLDYRAMFRLTGLVDGLR